MILSKNSILCFSLFFIAYSEYVQSSTNKTARIVKGAGLVTLGALPAYIIGDNNGYVDGKKESIFEIAYLRYASDNNEKTIRLASSVIRATKTSLPQDKYNEILETATENFLNNKQNPYLPNSPEAFRRMHVFQCFKTLESGVFASDIDPKNQSDI